MQGAGADLGMGGLPLGGHDTMALQVAQQRRALHACRKWVPQLKCHDAQAEDVHLVIIARPPVRHLCDAAGF